MNHRLVLPFQAILLTIGLLGCQVVTPLPPRYEVDTPRLAEGPPPMASGVLAGGQPMVLDPVQIEPEKSVGYAQLPTSVTQLFDRPPVPLGLGDVVNLTLANERGLTIQGYDLRVAQYQVPVAKGIYDLLLSAGLSFSRVEEQISPAGISQQPIASERMRRGNIGLSQLFPSGATLSLAYNLVRHSSLIVNFDQNLNRTLGSNVTVQQVATLGISQPLLRGFGPSITNAGIRIAQLEDEGAAADFQTNLEKTLVEVLGTYWELIGAIELYKVREIAYSAARDLLRINTAKFDAGVLPQTDVLQAKAAVESRRADLINARQSVRDIEDDLKRRIFLQAGEPKWDEQVRPTQPIAWRELQPDQDQMIALALSERSELRRARSVIEQSKVNLRVAENAKLPALNLFGQINTNGLDTNFDRSFDTFGDSKYNSYDAGVEFSFPLQNRAARFRFKQAEARGLQAQESLRQLRDQITLEVRKAVRALRTAREQIEVTRSAVVSEEEKLRSEMKRSDVGVSTAFEVLTFQNDLANAQAQHINAVIDYNLAALQLERARGTFLQNYGVTVVDVDLAPRHEPVKFPVGWN